MTGSPQFIILPVPYRTCSGAGIPNSHMSLPKRRVIPSSNLLAGFSTLFGIVALAAVTRYLGQEGFGWYTTVLLFTGFGILSDFALTLITAQMLSQPGANEENFGQFSLRRFYQLFYAAPSVWFSIPPLLRGRFGFVAVFYATTLQNIFVGFIKTSPDG